MRIAISMIAGCIMLFFTGTQVFAALSSHSYLQPVVISRDDPSVVINRPPNVQGLTGLIFTNSAYTQPKGSIVAGVASIAENSRTPNFSIVQGIATITAGVTDRIEIGVRAQMIATNLGSSATREVGFGDTDVLVKWRISSQDKDFPAVAIGLACTLPTGDEDQGLNSVKDQSVRVMVIGTSEQEMPGDFFVGMYFEGQIVSKDRLPWDDKTSNSEKYGVFNAGLLLPLNESRNLQAMLEYNGVVKKDMPSVYERNHKSLMPGLRFVTEKLNVSLGLQFFNPEDPVMKNDLRYIGTLSYAF